MRTQIMIMLIVLTILMTAIAALVGLIVWLGWLGGVAVGLGVLAALLAVYFRVIKPWHLRWGATDDEIARTMPGDELIPGAGTATHAITIDAPPDNVWPWLVQIGYGRAGWYSYDWIDNDFKPSADRIIPEYQDLEVGDKILMMPTMGFEVKSIDPTNSIVSLLEDGSTSWCLGLYPDGADRTRLVSRWHPKFEPTPATVALQVLAEPGTFIMEQKMLRTIRDRAEQAARG